MPGVTLVIARLDRLSRNAAFLLTLRDSGVAFLAVDMPEANDLTVGVMALVMQQEREGEAKVAKVTSLLAKIGALLVILVLPTQFALDLQLLGGVWILQTLPALLVGLYPNWFRAPALLVGWVVGFVGGTWLVWDAGWKPLHAISLGGEPRPHSGSGRERRGSLRRQPGAGDEAATARGSCEIPSRRARAFCRPTWRGRRRYMWPMPPAPCRSR